MYNINIDVAYKDNETYRKCLRQETWIYPI